MAAGTQVQIIGTPGHSPALKYEMQLAEVVSESGGGKEVTSERLELCFSILDEIIPQLGVFQRVIKRLRNELYNAAYSDEYSAGMGRRRSDSKASRVPHFIIAKRVMEERDKHVSKLKGHIESLREQLYNCEADLEKASSAVEAYRYDLKESEAKIQQLTQDLRTVLSERNHLQAHLAEREADQEQVATETNHKISQLQSTVSSLETKIKDLDVYKTTHDQIQRAFLVGQSQSNKTTHQPLSTKVASLQQQSTIDTLHHQVLHMRNKLIDEYEEFLNSHRVDKITLMKEQGRFKKNIELIENELSLLSSHRSSVASRLSHINSLDPSLTYQAIVQSDHPASPLVSQEQTLNRYSSLVYVSTDDGKNYYLVKEARQCLSCGTKVVICSHWGGDDLILSLPLHSTHIKISHPVIHAPVVSVPTTKVSDTGKAPPPLVKQSSQLQEPDFERIWLYYNRMFNVNGQVPRTLSLSNIKKLVLSFYSIELQQEGTLPTDNCPSRIMAAVFFDFMLLRYHVPSVGPLVLHDFITGLSNNHTSDSVLFLFSHILSGTVDSIVFHYYLLLADLLNAALCSTINHFTQWIAQLYPFLEEDSLEQLSIEFVGHSLNHINKHSVMDYVLWLLLKHREPLVLQMEALLGDCQSLSTGSMTETEFAEACLAVLPKANGDILATKFYGLALARLKDLGRMEPSVPTRHLSYIVAYIDLLHRYPDIEDALQLKARNDPLLVVDKTVDVDVEPFITRSSVLVMNIIS